MPIDGLESGGPVWVNKCNRRFDRQPSELAVIQDQQAVFTIEFGRTSKEAGFDDFRRCESTQALRRGAEKMAALREEFKKP